MVVVDRYPSACWVQKCQHQTYERCLSRTRFAKNSRTTSRRKRVREVVENLLRVLFGIVLECQVLNFYAALVVEFLWLAVGLERLFFEFHQTLARRKNRYERWDKLRYVEHRTLYSCHELHESRHHSEGYLALRQSVCAPHKGYEISAAKADRKRCVGKNRESRAVHNLRAQNALTLVELYDGVVALFERFQHHAVLHALLQDALYRAVALAHILVYRPHL